MRILIIEDEPKVVSFLKEGLIEAGYEIDVAYDGQTGKSKAMTKQFDLVLLDIMIPLLNGVDLCKILHKAKPDLPIIMLTALDSVENKIQGFEAGADDYLVKPFEFIELLARIRAILNRFSNKQENSTILKFADLVMNMDEKTVYRDNNLINLSAKEFDLLELFLRNPNRVLSRDEIASKIWKISFDSSTNIIDVYMSFLRKKIDKDNPVKLLHTHFGFGYVLKA